MLRSVSIIGVGVAPFGRRPDASLSDFAHPAILDAVDDAGIGIGDIEAAYCGNVLASRSLGQRLLQGLGRSSLPVFNVENACSSGSSAVHLAWSAVASGACDVALAFGVEKLSVLGPGALPLADGDIEAEQGMIMPAVYAMRAVRHMAEYGTTREQLAAIAVKNRGNGALNPKAQFREPVTIEEVLASRAIAGPLSRLQCCPTGDGAAAVVLAADDVVSRLRATPVRIRASVVLSGAYSNGPRDMAKSGLSAKAAGRAYETAGLGAQDLDVVEVHDAFTIGELMACEALGLCAVGEGGPLIAAGATEIGGRIPVNPSGGLLARGHPVGATGVAQLAELADQLRGRCGPRQVADARIGLTHCTGGGAAGFDHTVCSIHILEKAR